MTAHAMRVSVVVLPILWLPERCDPKTKQRERNERIPCLQP
jgi:hypothetical protein